MIAVNDQNRINQVTINLISNALKFTSSKNGLIELRAKRISDNEIEISVKDNGLGMKKENIDKLGKIFFTHNRGSKNNHGIGLGLYISS